MLKATVVTQRLDLVPLSLEFLEMCIARESAAAEGALGYQIPADWFDETWLMQLRRDQAREDPAFVPWLPWAVCLREGGVMVGHLNFHTAPGPDYLADIAPDGIEFGYTIFEAYRQRGYAREAVAALMQWAAEQRGIARFVLSISPDNTPSLRIAHSLGFRNVGQHIDDEDGPEDIYLRDK